MTTARNGGVLSPLPFNGSAWLHGLPHKGGAFGLPVSPTWPVARAGGVFSLGFYGGSKTSLPAWTPRAGGVFSLGFGSSGKLPDPIPNARKGGAFSLGFYGGTKAVPPVNVSRSGGAFSLSFYGGTRVIQGPTVGNQNPAPGSVISAGTLVSFDVTDVRAFLFLEVQVDQTRRETIHDGDTFLDPYLSSIRIPIPGGWRYQVRRSGGWVVAPTFRVRVYDILEQGG